MKREKKKKRESRLGVKPPYNFRARKKKPSMAILRGGSSFLHSTIFLGLKGENRWVKSPFLVSGSPQVRKLTARGHPPPKGKLGEKSLKKKKAFDLGESPEGGEGR